MLLFGKHDLYLYHIHERKLERLTKDYEPEIEPAFSPNGRKLAFIKHQNLVVFDLKSKTAKQLTKNNNPHVLIGQFNWVYKEQFRMDHGFEWSPDSRYISFYRLDTRPEPEYPVVFRHSADQVVKRIKYPRAGDPTALVQIGIADVKKGSIIYLDNPAGPDDYITRTTWLLDSDRLVLSCLNRDQNRLKIVLADIKANSFQTLLREYAKDGWLNPMREPLFLNGKNFLWLSDLAGYNHIHLYDLKGRLKRKLTSGSWDVAEIISAEGKRVYFTAAIDRNQKNH